MKQEMNLVKLIEQFKSEDACRERLAELRWPDGVECPRCKTKKITPYAKRDQYDCRECDYRFSVTSGTIFADSHLPLWKWFLACYLICESRKGISANQLKRTLAVTYKTAWYLCHRIRAAMVDADDELLDGTVEIDETYLGGRNRYQRRGDASLGVREWVNRRVMVMGAIERGGKLRVRLVTDEGKPAAMKFIGDHVAPDADHLYTDQRTVYRGMAPNHEAVNHSKDEWVVGEVHTNTIESAWSLLDRAIMGSYHKLSMKHLPAYLAEFEFRFNNRENPYLFRDTMSRLVQADPLTYKKLVKQAA